LLIGGPTRGHFASASHFASTSLEAAPTAPSENPRGVGLPRDGQGGSGYPVASASLSRSRPGVGGPAGAPNALNELDPLPQVCYASGVDATGYPCAGDHHSRARSWTHPGAEVRRRHVCLIELGNLPTVPGDACLPADSLYRGVPQLTAVDPSFQHANSMGRVFRGHDRGEEAVFRS